MFAGYKCPTGRGRNNVRPLLKQVNGRQHATDDDHEVEHARSSPAKRLKTEPSPAGARVKPEETSDVDRDPESSDDDSPSRFDIPSSFKSKSASPVKKTNSQPAIRGRKAKPDTDGANDDRSKTWKALPPALDENADLFGEPIRNGKKAKKTMLSTKPLEQYGKKAAVKREFKKSTSLSSIPPARTFIDHGEFHLPSPPSSKPKSESSLGKDQASQGSSNTYAGAEDYLDSEERQGVELPRARKKPSKRKKVKEEPEFEDAPPSSGTFKMPDTFTQGITKLDNDKDVKAERAKQEKREKKEAERASKLPDQGECPMHCGKILPRTLLETLSPDASIREQQAFCHRHQVVDAKKEWQLRKYPTIDWDYLPKRLEEDHDDNIHHLLFFPDQLHFRKLMEERIKSGKSRNLLQQHQKADLDYLGAGYYGLKGQELITAYIGKHFASSVSKRAEIDPVMSAQGPMAYVQEVLVLEIVTLLIKEDMQCDEVRAREIMAESTYIGELLWPSESAGGAKRRTRRLAHGE